MKASLVIAAFMAAALGVAAGSGPASADGGWRRSSVFPQPSDPWRAWGRTRVDRSHPKFHHNHTFHHDPKSHHGRVHGKTVIVAPRAHHFFAPRPVVIVRQPSPLWVSGYWAWNGFGWVWMTGYWTW
jgi:hypothetical protein